MDLEDGDIFNGSVSFEKISTSKKIKRILTGSIIDQCYTIYSILLDLYRENDTDELDYEYAFKEIMKRGKGSLNSSLVMKELKRI